MMYILKKLKENAAKHKEPIWNVIIWITIYTYIYRCVCVHIYTHHTVKKLPILGEVLKFFMLPIQSQEHLAIKYYFQERNQHTVLVLIAIFAFEYWLIEFLPLPILNSMLVWSLNTYFFFIFVVRATWRGCLAAGFRPH